MDFPKKLSRKIDARIAESSLRTFTDDSKRIDFSSNDYLGFSRSEEIARRAESILKDENLRQNGATGSRLISGNHKFFNAAELLIASFHQSESALIFNSGYDANIGFFSSVPQRGDIIFFDEYCHASIRDGIRMSDAKSYKFTHNNLDDLQRLLAGNPKTDGEIYVASESVFSMDGDTPDLASLTNICKQHGALLVLDEAHAVGVFGNHGEGLAQAASVSDGVFARIVTFGKALGCHGAAVLGSSELKTYLVNFARSFIYTTALPPHAIATILSAYRQLETDPSPIGDLRNNMRFFVSEANRLGILKHFITSDSAIQSAVIPGNARVKSMALCLQADGFDVRPILSPTVPSGSERLRICLHSFNTEAEISQLLTSLARALSV